MGTITLSIDDETERRFRSTAKKVIGERKGYLGEAATDAMKLWIHETLQSSQSLSPRRSQIQCHQKISSDSFIL
ncbi:MAG: hypothetical protein XD88_0427 [Methanocalculus sp. 52_23]|nr:MAG: hypothetical protein XD88_0427 [Methanocalculus sp. 52_23]